MRQLPPLAPCSCAAAAAPLPAQEYVWLEGEAPTRATVKFETGGWGHAEYLSGGSWLHGSVEPKDMEAKIPAEGAVLSYDFDAKAAGDYEAWASVGYEFVRSPFSWRLDDGAWKESKPDELTTDLMSLQAWNEVAWLKLGGVAVQPGKHTFEIKFDRQYKDGQRQEGAGPTSSSASTRSVCTRAPGCRTDRTSRTTTVEKEIRQGGRRRPSRFRPARAANAA